MPHGRTTGGRTSRRAPTCWTSSSRSTPHTTQSGAAFVFTYVDRAPVELFIAVMAWGLGLDNRGPAKVARILDRARCRRTIKTVVDSVRHDGAAAGYSTYYSGPTLPQLDIAFITKLLYFAGYQENAGRGRSSTTTSSPPQSSDCPTRRYCPP